VAVAHRRLVGFLGPALAALALAVATAGAQTVSGTVRDSAGPVVGARVRLLDLDRAVRSGAGGAFRFTSVPRGTWRLFVAAPGYASVTDTVRLAGDSASVPFFLQESAVPLEEIVVSASPFPRASGELYQPAASETRLAFDNSPGSNFAEKLSDLPGVNVRGNGSAPDRPVLRGLGDNEVLVLENGLRMGDVATYDPAHATPIDAMGIAEVDVVRGPATVLYGPNTIGGLVNVITNFVPTASDHPISGTVALEGNTVSGGVSGYTNTVVSGGGSAFRISAGGLKAGDIRIPTGTYTDPGTGAAFALDRIPQSFNRSGEVGLGYSYQGDFGFVGLGGNHYEANYGIPGVPPNPDWMTVPPTTSRIAQRRNTLELRSLLVAGGTWLRRVTLDASYNDYTHSEYPTAQDSSGVSSPEANHFLQRELNAVLQVQHRPFGRVAGTVGLWADVQNLQIEGDQPLGPNSVTTGLAAFAFEELRAAARTRLQAGVRYDYNRIRTRPYAGSPDSVFRTLDVSRLSNALTASLGAIQQLGPGLAASFSVARSFRAPTVQELYANGLDAASGTYSVGDATLGPETGLGLDATLRGTVGRVRFAVSPYVNVLDHYIYAFLRGDTIQGFPVRQFAATRARLFGYEATVTVLPTPHLALLAGSDYVNAQDTRRNVPLPFIPPLRGLVRATYQGRVLSGSAELRLAARQNRLGDGDTPTPGSAVFNLGIGLRLVTRGMVSELGLHCDNVLNAVYRDPLSVIKDFVPQPGRGFRLDYALLY
jgi:iron complex outermembrane recepter protein